MDVKSLEVDLFGQSVQAERDEQIKDLSAAASFSINKAKFYCLC